MVFKCLFLSLVGDYVVRVLFWVKDLPEDVDEELECEERGGSLVFIDDDLACVRFGED